MTVLRGYPGAGKSHAAAELSAQTGAVIVCRDTIRKRLFGRYTQVDEDAVSTVETAEVTALLEAGKSVIIDAMHLNSRYVKRWANLAGQVGCEFDLYDVLTEVPDCIIQDADIDRVREGKHVGPQVISKLAKKYPQSRWQAIEAPDAFVPVPYESPKDKPFAIIVDIDGTLAHIPEGGRSHYDYTKVSQDVVDLPIKHIVTAFQTYSACDVIIVSGREDTCRDDTHQWLVDNNIPFDNLHMRLAKDYRNDTIVKYEIFDTFIRDNYRVLFCLDDRNRVVDMWRSLGLKCLQVAEGSF